MLSFSSVGQFKSHSFINEFFNIAKAANKEKFSLISSENNLIPFLTVIDYITLGLNKPSKYVRQDLLDILPEFKLTRNIIDSKIIKLSTEEIYFIQIIFALLSKQENILIDDVSSNKAIDQLETYYDLLTALAKKYSVAITIVSSIY